MKKITTLTFFFLSFLFIQSAKASHIAGGDLSYVCLGGNQYQLNLNTGFNSFQFTTKHLEVLENSKSINS